MSNLTIKHAGTTQTATAGTEKKGGALVKLSPTILAAAYTEGDIIFTKQEIANAVATRGGCSLLHSITMYVEGAATADDLVLLFFDNDTAIGEPAGDPASDITAAEFIAASCIGQINLNGGTSATGIAAGRLFTNQGMIANSSEYGASTLFIQAASTLTSIWVLCFQLGGTLDTETDGVTCTFGFQYI